MEGAGDVVGAGGGERDGLGVAGAEIGAVRAELARRAGLLAECAVGAGDEVVGAAVAVVEGHRLAGLDGDVGGAAETGAAHCDGGGPCATTARTAAAACGEAEDDGEDETDERKAASEDTSAHGR